MNADPSTKTIVEGLSPKDRRILWILNHTTLRNVEVKMLVDMGFEVFCPKSFPDEAGNRSASVDWSWDQFLTIPAEDLAILNATDFYETPIDPQVEAIINEHFGTAIFAAYAYVWDQLLSHFRGRLLLRAFGLTAREWNYLSFSESIEEPGFRTRLMKSLNRFWFAQAYPNLSEIEPDFIERRSATLPLGLPDSIWKKANTWTGNRKQVVFVCPDIELFNESRVVYKNFKRLMGNLPHIILGAQGKPESNRRKQKRLKDPHVAGRLPRAEFDAVMQESSVMYYHSRLPRHLHYHPLEAVCLGMPLIFMRQGMLGQLGGANLPGACGSGWEAKRKLKRVLNGDQPFINAVVKSQAQLLTWFDNANVVEYWQREFLARILSTVVPLVQTKRVAIILGREQSDLTRQMAINFALKYANGSGEESPQEVVFAAELEDLSADEREKLYKAGIVFRPLTWKEVDHKSIFVTQEYSGYKGRRRPYERRKDKGYIPKGAATDFQDCDLWYIVADFHDLPIAAIHPYKLVINDLFAAEWPLRGSDRGFLSLVSMARDARLVITPTNALKEKALSELGLTPPWVQQVDVSYSDDLLVKGMGPDAPITILLDASASPDIEVIAASLRHYRFVDNGSRPIRVVCLGGAIEGFAPLYANEHPDQVMNAVGGRLHTLPALNLSIEIFSSQISSVRAITGSASVVIPHPVRNISDILRRLVDADIPVAIPDQPLLIALVSELGARWGKYKHGSWVEFSATLKQLEPGLELSDQLNSAPLILTADATL